MKNRVKNLLKKIVPTTISVFNREIDSVKDAFLRQFYDIRNRIVEQNERYSNEFDKKYNHLLEVLSEQNSDFRTLILERYEILSKRQEENTRQMELLFEKAEQIQTELLRLLDAAASKQQESLVGIDGKIENAIKIQGQIKFELLELLNMRDSMQQGILDGINGKLDNVVCKEAEILSYIDNHSKKMLSEAKEVKENAMASHRCASESVWAQIFKDTIQNSDWLKDKTFSPGRWAAGYPYLYVLYRVLNEAKPRRILELGLGQTTRMIAQYATANSDVKHFVVENDLSWIEFFRNGYDDLSNTEIVQLDLEMIEYMNVEGVRTYKGFAERFEGEQFDLICIDAPWAGDMLHYARIDILRIMPSCLCNNFVIIVDDYDRKMEQRTMAEIVKCLEQNDINYKVGVYRGKRDTALICAKHQSFLASM